MGKKLLLSLAVLIMLFAIAGCGNSNEENSKTDDISIVDDNTNSVNNDSITKGDSSPTITNGDSLPIIEVNKTYYDDLPLGIETNYVESNGTEVVIRIQTSGSSEQQANGPYYIYYNVYVGNDDIGFNCARDAIYHLEGYGITMLKEFDEEEDIGVNYEFFEWDFTSSAHKGGDKDYVAISIPAGTEDKPQASLLITTDNGKLLGEFIVDVVHDTDLTGPDVEKYRNNSGDIVFNSVKDGNITYLTPTEAMYITDSNGKKQLDPSLAEIELEEHSVTMSNNKAIDAKTNNIYKITNASGKAFNFGEFRHL